MQQNGHFGIIRKEGGDFGPVGVLIVVLYLSFMIKCMSFQGIKEFSKKGNI